MLPNCRGRFQKQRKGDDMGKVDDYTSGRAAGMLLARDIVKKDGLEELEKRNPLPEYHRDKYDTVQERTGQGLRENKGADA